MRRQRDEIIITTVSNVINILNQALAADADAIQVLIDNRVECNETLADHPTIQVKADAGKYSVGLLGIINGLFGCDTDGWGFVTARYDDDGKLIRFEPTPPRKAHRV